MIIATYNLRMGGRAGHRVHWRRILDELGPDLFLVQESLHPEEYLSREEWERWREGIVWAPAAGNRWGSAILSPGATVEPIDCGHLHGWVVGAEITGFGTPGDRPLRAFSVHVPTSRSSYVREAHRVFDLLSEMADGANLVVGGDFNVGVGVRHEREPLPNRPQDLALLERIRTEFGLVSAWQAANPSRDLAQTLRWSKDRALPFHCDGIFLPASWLPRLRGCEVVSGGSWSDMSDHNPVVASFGRLAMESAHSDRATPRA